MAGNNSKTKFWQKNNYKL